MAYNFAKELAAQRRRLQAELKEIDLMVQLMNEEDPGSGWDLALFSVRLGELIRELPEVIDLDAFELVEGG